jgi:hypothetical protein
VVSLTDPATGWDARLWRLWALYTALAYTLILVIVVGLASLGLDLTRVALEHRAIGALLIATVGALLYGGVLGRLQWRVLRERLPIPRRSWVHACVIPALVSWLAVVVPAAVDADAAGEDLRVAYFLAVSQALALGPLIGFAQARALRPYTRRWKWWIPANLLSWLVVDAIFFVVSQLSGLFDFAEARGSALEAYVVLMVATPVSARWLLWVTSPSVVESDAGPQRS